MYSLDPYVAINPTDDAMDEFPGSVVKFSSLDFVGNGATNCMQGTRHIVGFRELELVEDYLFEG